MPPRSHLSCIATRNKGCGQPWTGRAFEIPIRTKSRVYFKSTVKAAKVAFAVATFASALLAAPAATVLPACSCPQIRVLAGGGCLHLRIGSSDSI
jgi:hypothetical protein